MEEKLLFKNTSKMGKEEMEVFQNFAIKKTAILASLTILSLCLCAAVGFYFVSLYLSIAIAVAGIIGVFIMPVVIKKTVNNQNAHILQNKKYLNSFEFFEDKIKITNEVSDENSNVYQRKAQDTLIYSDIHHVIVYGIYFYIFLNKYQSLILDQRGMTKGVFADLMEFFKSKNIKVEYKKEFKLKK